MSEEEKIRSSEKEISQYIIAVDLPKLMKEINPYIWEAWQKSAHKFKKLDTHQT